MFDLILFILVLILAGLSGAGFLWLKQKLENETLEEHADEIIQMVQAPKELDEELKTTLLSRWNEGKTNKGEWAIK